MKVKNKAKKLPIWWDYRDHAQCPVCGIVIGGVEEYYISEYREHMICSWCQAQWRYREELVGHKISLDGFILGKLKKR